MSLNANQAKINSGDERDAIWVAFFSREIVLIILGLALIIIFFAALFFPDHSFNDSSSAIERLCKKIPDIRLFASKSDFPFAAALSYFFALAGAYVVAIFTSCAKLNMKPLQQLTQNRSTVGRVVVFFGLFLFLISPFLFEMKVADLQFSSHFFKLVESSRFFMLFWVGGVFLGCYVFWLWLFLECANFYRFFMRICNA